MDPVGFESQFYICIVIELPVLPVDSSDQSVAARLISLSDAVTALPMVQCVACGMLFTEFSAAVARCSPA